MRPTTCRGHGAQQPGEAMGPSTQERAKARQELAQEMQQKKQGTKVQKI